MGENCSLSVVPTLASSLDYRSSVAVTNCCLESLMKLLLYRLHRLLPWYDSTSCPAGGVPFSGKQFC